jgi:protein TonB
VTQPVLIREVKPNYTAEAMRAKIQGVVWLEAVVLTNGQVGQVRVTRSLDPTFGLDLEAEKTVKQWRFTPGTRLGQPVPVLIEIEMSFTLR